MPSARKQAILQKSRKRQGRGRLYLILAIALIAIIGVGAYVYAMSQQQPAIVYAKLNTSKGLIEVELYQSMTPITVTNFVNLAKSSFYSNLVWHRISPGFVIQVGDPTTANGGGSNSTWGQHGSTTIQDEIVPSLHNYAGYLAMANTGAPNSGSSQFFINLVDNSALDGKYTVFGKVIVGMNVAQAISNVPLYSPVNGICCQPIAPYPFLVSVTISNSP